ncbi:MAG: hypothetical protein KJ726_09180 [Verrucomicrobia bacterium]|nr:hypothetical protein [Verrucomicrobiota bacterium]MBU1910209.1 hypothetical protein [Verrucomicrobiota bacterium]
MKLNQLDQVVLNNASQALMKAAAACMDRATAWGRRKLVEYGELVKLAQIAPYRLRLADCHLDADPLMVLVAMNVPVPLELNVDGTLRQSDLAVLGIVYPEAVVKQPLPGTAFVEVTYPPDVFHPNIAKGPRQQLCLGATMPRGIPLREIIVLSYAALCGQSVTIDFHDPVGVLNLEACRFFEAHPQALPLTKEPFLCRGTSTHPEAQHA